MDDWDWSSGLVPPPRGAAVATDILSAGESANRIGGKFSWAEWVRVGGIGKGGSYRGGGGIASVMDVVCLHSIMDLSLLMNLIGTFNMVTNR